MAERAKVLFVDDEKQILLSLNALFHKHYEVFLAETGAAALDILGRETIHVLVSDERMPNMLGHELLRAAKQKSPRTMRLLLTGYAERDAILGSINDGEIFRFINKPWDNLELRTIVGTAAKIALNTADIATALVPNDMGTLLLKKGIGILVLDETPALQQKVQRLCGPEYPAYRAATIDKALDYLHQADIAVLVADLAVGREATIEFLKLLKRQYPAIMSIVFTEVFDAAMAIALINQAKVYRYFNGATPEVLLQRSLQQGLRLFETHTDNPQLLQRQEVEAMPETLPHNASLTQRLVGRFKGLRARLR